MKYILSIALATLAGMATAQQPLVPGSKSVESKWIKDQSYKMTWYAIRDTAKIPIGEVSTEIKKSKNHLTIVSNVALKNRSDIWVDSTVAKSKTLAPVRHSSSNTQRDMLLLFDKVVTGYYLDKTRPSKVVIHDTPSGSYFDSNLYPHIITWLPLGEGYVRDLMIYDYNPAKKIGVIRAYVKGVESGTYHSKTRGNRSVWIVTVSDEISGGAESYSVYYIDKKDRILWQQLIHAGVRKMMMQRVE